MCKCQLCPCVPYVLHFVASWQPFGDIRNLYSACKHRGFVMVSYFDIRAARTAMRVLQNKQLRNKKLDIHFSFPKVWNSKDGIIVFICALDLIILYMSSACLVYISYIDSYRLILTFCFLKNIFHSLETVKTVSSNAYLDFSFTNRCFFVCVESFTIFFTVRVLKVL